MLHDFTIKKLDVIFCVVAFFAVTGIFSIGSYNILPAANVIELVTLFLVLLFSDKILKENLLIAAFSIILFVTLLGIGYLSRANVFDVIIASKFTFMLAMLALSANLGTRFRPTSIWLLRIIFFLYVTKYMGWYIFPVASGFHHDRPGLFMENNFELIFFIAIFILLCLKDTRYKFIYVPVSVATLLLSGSKSGIVTFFAIFPLILFNRNIHRFFYYLFVIFLLFIFFESFYQKIIFSDRAFFFLQFVESTKDWEPYNWLFGSGFITPLPNNVCEALSFYEQLFSRSGNGECYSVILHSFWLRMIYDFGVAGSLFVFFAFFIILKVNHYGKVERASLIMTMALNGLSVSSFNSIFMVLSFFILARERKNETQS